MPSLMQLLCSWRHRRNSHSPTTASHTPPSPEPHTRSLTALDAPLPWIPQRLAPFFALLAPEIRLHIYSYLIPHNKAFHVVSQQYNTRSLLQPAGNSGFALKHDVSWHTDGGFGRFEAYPPWSWPKGNPIPMDFLLVCRQIHDEVLNLLYSTKTFYIDAPTSLLHLRHHTPLYHFTQIASLRLMFCSTYASPRSPINVKNWNEMTSILRQLSNLRCVHILLSKTCWDDFFDMRSDRYHEHNAKMAGHLIDHTLAPWYRDPIVQKGIEQVVPYLDWAKDIAREGEVSVQMFERLDVGDEGCTYVLVDELWLRDGSFVGR